MTKARDLANSAAAFASVSATELGYVDGVTSAIQTQMDAKAPSSTAVTLTGTQTLTNKTLTSPVIASVINNTLTSTTGDIIYASAANTPARLAIGSASQVLTVASGIPSWATPSGGGMTLLSTTTMTGSSVTLSSISGSYKALKIYIRNPQMATSGWGLFMRFNSDATANYHYWNNIGTTLYGAPGWNATKISVSNDNGTNLQGLGLISIDIPDYANSTSWKMSIASALTVADNTTTGLQYQTTQGSYYGTAAVTSLQFFSGSGNLTSGTIYLYGVN